MLSLTRRIHEEILVIAPTGYRCTQAKIGIEASKDRFTILRREVLEQDGSTDPVWSKESTPAPSQYYLAPWPNQRVPSERAPGLWQD